jgi:hypothetical protein
MVWWNGHIIPVEEKKGTCLGLGLHQWKEIASFSKDASTELTHTWWMVRRFVAWTAKVPDDELPPVEKENVGKEESLLLKNVFWDGSARNQMKNI